MKKIIFFFDKLILKKFFFNIFYKIYLFILLYLDLIKKILNTLNPNKNNNNIKIGKFHNKCDKKSVNDN